MSRPFEQHTIKAAVTQFFTVFLLSLGLSLPVLRALFPLQALWPAAVICLMISLGFEALYLLPLRRKWILPAAALAALGVWGALGGGPVHAAVQLVKAGFLSLRGIPDAAAPYADAARWTVCLLFTLLSAALAWDDTLPLAVFSVVTVLTLVFVFSEEAGLLLCALPAAAGLLLMMAQGKEEGRLSPLPLAAVLAALAFFIMPAKPETVPQLSRISQDIRQFLEDYLLFNDYRASFSLAGEGYQPLQDRLGGPAEPQGHTVLEAETARTVLLKGKSYDTYTGLNWTDTLSSRRYLYASPRFSALRESLFDLNRPVSGAPPEAETIRVRVLNEGTTTLFAPAHTRTLQMESERMVLYFNMAGELFITRNLQEGDRYTLTALPFSDEDPQTAQWIALCAGQPDPHYAEIEEVYTALPRHIQQEVFDIAHEAAGSAQTPYEKALNIMRYLRSHYRYELNVSVPPEGVDFTAWFLIGEKEGYCTYFATAMTVLCRIEGIPARYATGFIAAPDENGVATVTGKEAHAWTEIYLNGFGWLPLDATPRDRDGREPDGSGTPSGDQTPPSPTPTPSPTPAPTPTPAPEEKPEESPAPQEKDAPTPTPQPEENGLASPTPPPAAPEGEKTDGSFPWLWLLLLLALIAALILRFLWTEPMRRAGRQPERAAEILFAAIAGLLTRWGLRRLPSETLHEFTARADRQLEGMGLPALAPLAELLGGQVYGRHAAPAAPFVNAYTALRQAAGPRRRIQLALRRMARFRK